MTDTTESTDAPPIYPTMVSDLIRSLGALLEREGDMPVAAAGVNRSSARVFVSAMERYYDGGCLYPAEKTGFHCRHWINSRNHPGHKWICRIVVDEPEPAFAGDPTESRDTIDGIPVEDMNDG